MIVARSLKFVVLSQSVSESGGQLRARGELSDIAISVACCERNHNRSFSSFHAS